MIKLPVAVKCANCDLIESDLNVTLVFGLPGLAWALIGQHAHTHVLALAAWSRQDRHAKGKLQQSHGADLVTECYYPGTGLHFAFRFSPLPFCPSM